MKSKPQKRGNKEMTSRGKYFNRYNVFAYNIKAQLILGFLIPIVFVVLGGVFVYTKATAGMLNNFENSTMKTLQMTTEYLDFGFEGIQSDSLQLYNDNEISDYIMKTYKNDPYKQKSVKEDIYNTLSTKVIANNFIKNIHLITSEGLDCISTGTANGTDKSGFFKEWLEENQSIFGSNMKQDVWVSTHDMIDSRFKLAADGYAMSQFRIVSSNNACIVIDINKDKIIEILDKMKLGNGSELSFITSEGREFGIGDSGFSFSKQSYFDDSLKSEKTGGYQYITYDKKNYLYLWNKCQSDRVIVCALIPKETLTKEAVAIKKAVFYQVLLSCFLVLILGVLIGSGISRSISFLINRLSIAAKGDLTVDMQLKSKNEFGILSNHIMKMIFNTKHLVGEIITTVNVVTDSARLVASSAKALSSNSIGIKNATSEIDAGVNQQAVDAEQCLVKMDGLSGLILSVNTGLDQICDYSMNTGKMIQNGNESMKELTRQTNLTGEMTEEVRANISMLAAKIENIEYFVNSINEIAEETTLLSLNASIEAARAGVAGKSFAIVAEAIKRLADNSLKAAKEIQATVDSIQKMKEATIDSSIRASEVVMEQKFIVKTTIEVFSVMNESVAGLLKNVKEITGEMKNMTDYRGETLSAIESISSVMEETAASASIVNEAVEEQKNQVGCMTEAVTLLQKNIIQLEECIRTFNI